MADDYRRIQNEMDRFEAEISSLSRPGPPPHPSATPAFIPAQLRRQPTPAVIAAAPMINSRPSPSQVSVSGAPQMYRPPTIRPRIPAPQTTTTIQRGIRPMIRPPPGAIMAPPTSFSARPTISSPPVVSGMPVQAQAGFIPIGGGAMPGVTSMGGTSLLPTPVASIPLPPDQTQSSSEPKPSTSSTAESNDANDKGGKKKEKKNKKMVRCAGGTLWEDQSLQDWDTNDYRLFCGDLGNDVTDEVLTRVFGRYPSFQKARVIRDKRTNKTKGYGFVSFKDSNDFARAVKEVDGRYVGSRPIKLRKSTWKNRDIGVVRKRETERLQLLGIHKKPKLY